jgi:hypothetical protein
MASSLSILNLSNDTPKRKKPQIGLAATIRLQADYCLLGQSKV